MRTHNSLGESERLADEQRRLNTLDQYDILDSPEDEVFDRITRLVCKSLDVPMSTITFIDGHRQWFKSRQGMLRIETPSDSSFCKIVVDRRLPLVINDATTDPQFASNPFVIGKPFIRFYASIPFLSPEDIPLGTLCAIDTKPRQLSLAQLDILQELASLTRSSLELRKLAMIDTLTGVATRRSVCEDGTRALARARRYGHDFSLLVFDIDHFKRINDTYGHATGDAVLAGAVSACKDAIRGSDFIGRIGGEEFAIVLPHTDVSGAKTIAEKIRAAIERESYSLSRDQVKVTASVGVISARDQFQSFETLLNLADAALYEAKKTGRNRVCSASNEALSGSMTGCRVLKAGRIVVDSKTVAKCTVRRLTDHYADLQVSNEAIVPDRFILRIDADGLAEICTVLSRMPRRLEVAVGESASP